MEMFPSVAVDVCTLREQLQGSDFFSDAELENLL